MRCIEAATVAVLLFGSLPALAQRPGDCGYYTNSLGHEVPRPCGDWRNNSVPPPQGATALCRDGTYSFSEHHSGTCSGHGGVAEFLR